MTCDIGPQGRLRQYDSSSTVAVLDNMVVARTDKDRAMGSGGSGGSGGSVSGSPGRLQENVSRDSGIGCLKVSGSIFW